MKRLFLVAVIATLFGACDPEPPLFLHVGQPEETKLVFTELSLDTYWDYELEFGVRYDWRAEWYYGWDLEDSLLFGEIGYTLPNRFNIRRYYTGDIPLSHHTSVIKDAIEGTTYSGYFDYGFWDMLVFNDVKISEGVQSINFDETTTIDSVTVYTNPSMTVSRYQAPVHNYAFYQPEELYSAYEQAIEINTNLDGFEYDSARNVYVKRLNMILQPITYIYLTQVIVHHNNGRIVGVEGAGNLSGLARSSTVNTGLSSRDAVTVNHHTRWKQNIDVKGESVDIAGGRLTTFGICGIRANTVKSSSEVSDKIPHYMDLKMLFNNGLDSTFVFDVSEQLRKRYKGGVLTVEIDLDTVPIPRRSGGSAFDAVVEDYQDGGTHEFEM